VVRVTRFVSEGARKHVRRTLRQAVLCCQARAAADALNGLVHYDTEISLSRMYDSDWPLRTRTK